MDPQFIPNTFTGVQVALNLVETALLKPGAFACYKDTTLIRQKTTACFDMKDFSPFDKVIKLNWVKRVCSNSNACSMGVHTQIAPLVGVGGTELFKCNINYDTFLTLITIFPGRILQRPCLKIIKGLFETTAILHEV